MNGVVVVNPLWGDTLYGFNRSHKTFRLIKEKRLLIYRLLRSLSLYAR